MKQYDYILAGQGLAGTVLAQTLLRAGKTVLVIDDPSLSKASRVAAGLYNPVILKRIVKSWMVDELFPVMHAFYSDAEQLLGERFYFKKQIVKIFSEEREKALWLKKSEEDVGRYMSKTIRTDFLDTVIDSRLGSSEVLHAGNLDTQKFLSAFRGYFERRGMLLGEKLVYEELQIAPGRVVYKDAAAPRIIFCEGCRAVDNPWFPSLDFSLAKGEIITIRLSGSDTIPGDTVINKGVFILPAGDNTYRVGATYEWADLTEHPTEKARAELLEKLGRVLKVPYTVIGHQAGVRPTVSDRRPMLGVHPKHPELCVFNGMGTKGVMLAPYFAKQLVGFLENNIPFSTEVDIKRFEKS